MRYENQVRQVPGRSMKIRWIGRRRHGIEKTDISDIEEEWFHILLGFWIWFCPFMITEKQCWRSCSQCSQSSLSCSGPRRCRQNSHNSRRKSRSRRCIRPHTSTPHANCQPCRFRYIYCRKDQRFRFAENKWFFPTDFLKLAGRAKFIKGVQTSLRNLKIRWLIE